MTDTGYPVTPIQSYIGTRSHHWEGRYRYIHHTIPPSGGDTPLLCFLSRFGTGGSSPCSAGGIPRLGRELPWFEADTPGGGPRLGRELPWSEAGAPREGTHGWKAGGSVHHMARANLS